MTDRIDDPMLFDFEDLWGSDHVKLMTGDELAVYVRLLSCQWREGGLRADPRLLALRASHGERHVTAADLVGEGTLDDPSPGSIWEALSPCYQNDGEFIGNERVRVDREAWLKKKAGWKAGGEASAEARRKAAESRASEPPSEPPSEAPSRPPSEGGGPSLSPPDPSPSPGEKKGSEDTPLDDAADGAVRAAVPKPSKAQRDFARLVEAYPNPTKAGKAETAWCRLKAADRDIAGVLRFLRVAMVSEKWTKEDGRFVPGLSPFVNAKTWQDPLRGYPPAKNGPRAQHLGPLPEATEEPSAAWWLHHWETIAEDPEKGQPEDVERATEGAAELRPVVEADPNLVAEIERYRRHDRDELIDRYFQNRADMDDEGLHLKARGLAKIEALKILERINRDPVARGECRRRQVSEAAT